MGEALYLCPYCGAAVPRSGRDRHAEWHSDLSQNLTDLAEAKAAGDGEVDVKGWTAELDELPPGR